MGSIRPGRLTIQTAAAFPRPWWAGMGGTILRAPGVEPGQGTSAPTWAADHEQGAAPPGRAQSRLKNDLAYRLNWKHSLPFIHALFVRKIQSYKNRDQLKKEEHSPHFQ